jgi:TPR repeat protein
MYKRALLFITAMLVIALPLAHRAGTQTPSNDPPHHPEGSGGPRKDDREATRLLKLAAAQGNAEAQSKLGVFYGLGRGGLQKDDSEAARLFKLSADQGNPKGQYNLALFYHAGRGGLQKDEREAARLFKLAAAQGHVEAQKALKGIAPRAD